MTTKKVTRRILDDYDYRIIERLKYATCIECYDSDTGEWFDTLDDIYEVFEKYPAAEIGGLPENCNGKVADIYF